MQWGGTYIFHKTSLLFFISHLSHVRYIIADTNLSRQSWPHYFPENGGIMFLRNVGLLPTCPHGVTTQKTNIDITKRGLQLVLSACVVCNVGFRFRDVSMIITTMATLWSTARPFTLPTQRLNHQQLAYLLCNQMNTSLHPSTVQQGARTVC
jgi:hypothetical protein